MENKRVCRMHRKSNNGITVFIDGGFNKGQTFNKVKFHTPELGVVDKYFAFEPDPRQFDDVKFYVQEHGVIFFSQAMWINDTILTFNQCNRPDEQAGSVNSSKWMKGMVQVPAVDMVQWTQKHLCPEDYNILKLDIESAEYAVLPELMQEYVTDQKTGESVSLFQYYYDELWVEWHKARHFRNAFIDYNQQLNEWAEIRRDTHEYCEHYDIPVKVIK